MGRWWLLPAPQTWNFQDCKFRQDHFNAVRNSVSPCVFFDNQSVYKLSRRALRCFSCGDNGHRFENCTSEKRVKSQTKLIGNAKRLEFIRLLVKTSHLHHWTIRIPGKLYNKIVCPAVK